MSTTKLFAVFGNPILHSKSPQLFNAVFDEFGLDAYYTRIRPQSANDIINIIRSIPMGGGNITAPYKEEMVSLVDVVSLDAQEIGAINTIVNSDGRLIGYNTDHYGVTQSLKEEDINLLNARCLVLGGGGAARSVVYGLKYKGAQVAICNRTFSKAKAIADDFGCEVMSWDDFDTSINFDVIVSTIIPQALPPFLEKVHFANLFDASYKPSKVSEVAQRKGIRIIPGQRWLLHQAVESFRLYLGDNPPVSTMELALNKNLNREDVIATNFDGKTGLPNTYKGVNLIVSSNGLSQEQVNAIINEEISKAFGG